MFLTIMITTVLAFSSTQTSKPCTRCIARQAQAVHPAEVTPIICYGDCKIYIGEGGRQYPSTQCHRRLPARRPSYSAPTASTYVRPAPRAVRQETEEMEAPREIRKLHHDTLDLTPHTTSLFPTAITLPKGREFQDYRLFGLLSGVQYGVTDRLELGYKIVTPFVIGVMAEPDVFPYFLMWGVQANFKYQLVKGEFFNLAVMGAGPSPMGEVIVTLGGAKRALTMAAGAMHFLDSEVSLQWYRISGKLRLSSKAQLFGEYMDISTVGNPDDGMVLSSVALRRFWGRFNVDFGLGYMREKNDTDGLPLLYLNFGYSE